MKSKKYNIKLNGKVYEVEIEEVKEQNGENKENTIQQHKEEYKPQINTSGENIKAPMPGTIVNILVNENQIVKKGEVVLILEAMKMENEIVATVDGKISNINVNKNQNVNLGDSLLEII